MRFSSFDGLISNHSYLTLEIAMPVITLLLAALYLLAIYGLLLLAGYLRKALLTRPHDAN